GEMFKVDPQARERIIAKYTQVRDSRDNSAAEKCLARLSGAGKDETQNLMPLLVDCAHAYVTVGEMVGALKREWGEFQEPIRLG
ncbi:MAG: methylmalonyl-CoA mutase family protein, partial [bacterium]